MLLSIVTAALAAEPPPRSAFAPIGLAVSASLVGEALHDPPITEVYGDTSLSAEVSAAVVFVRGIEAGVSVGYRRIGGIEVGATGVPTGAATWLWYVPLSFTARASSQVGDLTVFAGAGPSLVFWSEAPKAGSDVGFSGGKYGLLVDGGLRVPIQGVGPSLFDPDAGVRGMDVEATLGYRASLLRHEGCAVAPCGLNFSALRLGVGVRARF